jgi:ParB family chromosome partitioning protein
MRQLGHATVPVWIASEVSDKLRTLLAIQDDNLLRKHFTTTEKAALYASTRRSCRENARRQAATRFGAAALPGSDDGEADDSDPEEKEVMIVATYQGSDSGRWDSQPPAKRKSRVQAATAVTGRTPPNSSSRSSRWNGWQPTRTKTNESGGQPPKRSWRSTATRRSTAATTRSSPARVCCWLEKTAVNESATAAVREAADDELRAVRQIDRPVERSRSGRRCHRPCPQARPHANFHCGNRGGRRIGCEDEDVRGRGPGRYHARRLVDILRESGGVVGDQRRHARRPVRHREQREAITSHRKQATAFLDTAADARRTTTGPGLVRRG